MPILNSDSEDKLRDQNQFLLQQLRDCERLHRVSQTICSALQVDVILKNIIDEAMSLCHAQQGSIMLFEPASPAIAKTLIRHGETAGNKLDHYLNNLLAGLIAQRRKPLLTNSASEAFGSENLPIKYRDIASILSAPLELNGASLGVINLVSLTSEQKFGERELHLLEILAAQAAQFIVIARLHEKLFAENLHLRKEMQDKYSFHGLIGHSPKMQELFALLQKVIPTEAQVVLEGENGTGKGLVARIIHHNGPRQVGPFVAVDCGALAATVLESELFGHVKGAFTDARQDKRGLFEEASGGTLFLDEIVNMPLGIQSKFLSAVQESQIRPVGSTKARKVDVRLIAAANTNLRTEVAAGRFRQDLFFRLNVVNIILPPLRERREDIVILAQHFLNKMTVKYGKRIGGFQPETMASLEFYSWPGNVRELEHVVERMVILAEPTLEAITPELLPLEIRPQVLDDTESVPKGKVSEGVKTMKEAYEKMILLEALIKHNWNQSAAARDLGTHEATLRFRMKKYGIKKP
ncbi:MAG: sigma 54-interacting transcriptional regulator [bacterium]